MPLLSSLLTALLLSRGIEAAFIGSWKAKAHNKRNAGRPSFHNNEVRLASTVSANNIDNLGLLHQVDLTQDKYYALDLGVHSLEDLAWIEQPGLAWEAAEMDAKALGFSGPTDYLNSIENAMRAFIETGIVHDREILFQFIDQVTNFNSFALLLGGKSVGKTLVLKEFAKRANRGDIKAEDGRKIAVLYVDGRKTSQQPISAALKVGWTELAENFPGIFGAEDDNTLRSSINKIIKASSDVASIVPKEWMEKSIFKRDTDNDPISKFVAPVLCQVLDFMQASEIVAVETFVAKATANGRTPVLVIDEANKVLGAGESTFAFLDSLVALTKRQKNGGPSRLVRALISV